jgi:hypothetical protein
LDHAPVVFGDVEELDVVAVADGPVGSLGGAGGFGGVFGDVAGEGGVADLPVLVFELGGRGGGDGAQEVPSGRTVVTVAVRAAYRMASPSAC